MKKLLIIGSSGLVGSKFASSISSDRKVVPNEIELDITDEKIVNDFFEMEKDNFDTVVNFAGFTNVDAAEKERGDENGFCFKLNVKGVENLAKASLKYDKFLIQISTDFVFNGTSDYPGPYSERSLTPDKLTEKMGWYGWTKNRSEFVVKKSGCKYAIVRIAYPFCTDNYDLKLDYAKNYLKLYDEGKLFPIFSDQTLSILLLDELVPALEKIIKLKE
ncbi:MAG: sugar nucleotide-binding protein, partial [Candidatus Woesebacteria bacterium]|nr:sugar nucleotide-binding protein [Candidatus Woesebacteria bacterium]